jgi:hypothetical protein
MDTDIGPVVIGTVWVVIGEVEARTDFAEGMIWVVKVEVDEETGTLTDDLRIDERHKLPFGKKLVLHGEVFGAHEFLRAQSWVDSALKFFERLKIGRPQGRDGYVGHGRLVDGRGDRCFDGCFNSCFHRVETFIEFIVADDERDQGAYTI